MRLGAVNKHNVRRIVLALIACCALSFGGIGDCDEEVNYTIVTGLNSAVNVAAEALINAAFQTVTPDITETDTGGDTVEEDPDTTTI